MTEVSLSPKEAFHAAQTGVLRYIDAIKAQRMESTGRDDRISGWDSHIKGALGEMAAAKALGIYPALAGRPDYDGDLRPGLHVRTTDRANGCLLLHRSDEDGCYMLVTGGPLKYVIRGFYTKAGAVPQSLWREDVPHPAFFVPQQSLRPFNELSL